MNHKQSPNNPDISGLDHLDPLDELLLKSPLPQPGPWFVAETVARCRREGQIPQKRFAFSWALGTGLSMAAFGIVACVLVVGFYTTAVTRPPVAAVEAPKPSVTDAFLVVASVDSNMEEECDDTSSL